MNRNAAEIFLEARAMPAEKRAGYLAGACGKDLALRAKVEALLKADAGSFMSVPNAAASAQPAVEPFTEQLGAQIGRYKLLEKIGEGGMGTIWMAEQREPVKRRVAIKIIKLGMDTKQVVARFEAERQALAMMDHPNIAKVFDAGATETGRPYFVMEYIKGIQILQYCDQEKVDTRTRLEMFTSVCHAIQHAHQKGIIHRDIKPSNVLVTLHDGVPVPKVIDFGIAKATHSELTTRTLFTEHGQMIGTPAYMSPEQAELSGLDIDTRSDVYSLGVLLYELLTGTTPFDIKALLASGFDEMLRAIREDEPHKPSTRISTLGDTGTRTAQQRRVQLKELSLLLRGDLDWIVMKCLEKDRTRRYETANGLAADVRRHLHDEPVTAGAPSAGYKLRKFIKRNRAQVIAASAVMTALLIAIVGTSWASVEASRARSAKIQRQLEDDQRTAAENARLMRNAEAVNALASECEDALRAGDAAKAKVALEAARKRSAEGGAEDDAERLERLAADLDLSTELDAIDQFLWTWAGNNFGNPAVAATRTRAALRRYGADPEAASVETATERAGDSAIRGRIVLAMDWLLLREPAETLYEVLSRVDSDAFRDAFRKAVLARDREEVERLARDPAALEQPPEFAAALGRSQCIPVDRRRELLEFATYRRPSDIVLLMALQGSYPVSDDTVDERMRWLQAAIATDPRNSGAYTNLGLALRIKGRENEALACYRNAVALNPQNAVACNNLGGLLNDMGQTVEAMTWLEKAIALDPKAVAAHINRGRALKKMGRVDEAMECYRKAIEVDPKDTLARGLLGDALQDKGQVDEAIACYRKAIELDPQLLAPYGQLGDLLRDKGEADEAIACYRKTVELDAQAAHQHSRLGDALRGRGDLDEAIACYRKAIELDPNYDAYGGLGVALKNKGGQLDEAIASLRKSIELRPDYAPSLQALSGALVIKGQTDEALSWAKKAVEIAPGDAAGQLALGVALNAKGQVEEAVACYMNAIELDPKEASAHHNLGATAVHRGKFDQALPYYRKATELEPRNGQWHLDLALVLQNLGQHDAAIESFRTSVELDPNLSIAHYNLGCYQQEKHRWDEAIDSYRKTIAIDPSFAEAHCNLAMCLQDTGRLSEALQCVRRGHELGSMRSDWSYPSAEWVRTAEMRAALEAKLPALLEGKVQPSDNAERFEYVIMCGVKKLYYASTKLSADAFAADPGLAADLGSRHRYDAAATAALAAAGLGEDSSQLDDRERSRLRNQAIDWLRADLALHTKRLETGRPEDRAAVQAALLQWQTDPDLACIRDPAVLAVLPVEDKNALDRLWADVAALLQR